jgi:hypothetical protein
MFWIRACLPIFVINAYCRWLWHVVAQQNQGMSSREDASMPMSAMSFGKTKIIFRFINILLTFDTFHSKLATADPYGCVIA